MPRPDQPPGNVAALPFFSVLTPRLTDTLIGACVMWQRQRKADGLPHDAELSDFVTALAGARRGQAGTSLDERSTTGDSDDTRLLLTGPRHRLDRLHGQTSRGNDLMHAHPGDNPAPGMPAQLSAADLAWLTRLPADPASISLEDGQVLAGMAAALPSGSADRRLVDSIWLPLKALHDTALAADTPPTTTEEVFASLPDAVIIPSDRLTAEESHTLISLFAQALGVPPPTPEEIDAERAERAGQPVTPQPGAQGKAQAAKRFGPSTTGPPAGGQGRAQAAKRFGSPTKPRAGQ